MHTFKRSAEILGADIGKYGYYILPYSVHRLKIYPNNITIVTTILCAMYSNFEILHEVTDITDFKDLLQQTKLQNSLEFLLFEQCVGIVVGKLSPQIHSDLLSIIRKSWLPNFTERSLSIMDAFLSNINTSLDIIEEDNALKAWYPFRGNVSGFALYRNDNSSLTFKEIYANGSSEANDMDLFGIAAYVPSKFLDEVTAGMSEDKKKHLRIIMVFVNSDVKLRRLLNMPDDILQFIGIAMPDIKKQNYLPMLGLCEHDLTSCFEFGQNYYDFDIGRYFPFFSKKVLYFGKRGVTKYEYRNTEYCLHEPGARRTVREEYFQYSCVNFNCFDPPITSNKTDYLYSSYIKCLYNRKNCSGSWEGTNTTFIDIYLYTAIISIKEQVSSTELLGKGLELLANSGKRCKQLIHLSNFLNLFNYFEEMVYVSPNFVYLNIMRDNTMYLGFALYNQGKNSAINYVLKPLTAKNFSVDYVGDDQIEVIVMFPREEMHSQLWGMEFFVSYSSDLNEDKYNLCKSRIIGVRCSGCFYGSKFDIYLKILDSLVMQFNIGYWSQVTLNGHSWVFICISQLSYDYCEDGCQISTHQSSKSHSPHVACIINQTTTTIDILSQLAVYMNPGFRETYHRHSKPLKAIVLVCSSLSIMGLVSIMMSAILIKGWYRKRYYTIQLSIALSFELAFFLMDNKSINQTMYMIFCYIILVQFFWMLMIGRIQYGKFVTVFAITEMDIIKSLLFGWLAPAFIIIGSIIHYWQCLRCNLCYYNNLILTSYVFAPLALIILLNFIIYLTILVHIWNTGNEINSEAKKARLKATIIFPFIFGLSWILIFAVISNHLWLSLLGSYFFHIFVPSQGFILFVFAIILDNDTQNSWRDCFTRCQQ